MAKNEARASDFYNCFVFKELHSEGSFTDSSKNASD